MENMKVAQCELPLENWGDESDPTSNWSLLNKYAAFSHREACEFILYVGSDEYIGSAREDVATDSEHIQMYEEMGFTKEVLGPCRNARKQGYKYICFWS